MGRPKGSKNRAGHKAGGFRVNSGRRYLGDASAASSVATDAASAAETAAVVAAAVVAQAQAVDRGSGGGGAGVAAAGAGAVAGVDGLLPPDDGLEPLPPLGSIEDSPARGQKRKASSDPADGESRAAKTASAAAAAAGGGGGGATHITSDDHWQSMFQELQKYADANGGSTRVKYTPETRRLYHWCHNQCTQYRNLIRLSQADKSPLSAGQSQQSQQYSSSMTQARIDALKSAGFDLEERTGGGVGANESKWNSRCELLVQYKNDHGGVCHDIPYTYLLDDDAAAAASGTAGADFKKLGKWCDRQRYWYRLLREGKKSQITEERAKKLEDLAFVGPLAVAAGAKPEVAGTVLPAAASASAAAGATDANADTSVGANKHAAKWEESFAELLEYKRTHGDCLVKYNYEANPKLARWVDRQRYWYKLMSSGKKSQMTQERVQKLQEAGFVFSLRGVGAGGGKAGDDGAGGDEDSAYCNQVQTAAASAAAVTGGAARGTAANTRRPTQETKWEVRLRELVEYDRRTGSLDIPHKFPENQPLANWAEKQKNELRLKAEGKPSQMTDEREARLKAIGFTFRSRATVWSERVEALRAYKAQYGHCRVPYTYAKDPKLAKWVSKQRGEMKARREGRNSQMTPERVVELRELEFWGPGEDDGSAVEDPPAQVAAAAETEMVATEGASLAMAGGYGDHRSAEV